MTLFSFIPFKRFATFWLILFAVWFGTSLLFFTFYVATGNALVSFASEIFTPIFMLVMAWLYFRKVARNDWTARTVTAVLWVGLGLVASAILMKPVYGVSWTYGLLSQNVAIGQAMNIVAILVGGYVAQRKTSAASTSKPAPRDPWL